MIRDQFVLDLNDELIVDNFAGGGGASAGIELALGRHVDFCWNHDPEACAMHQANHPQSVHFCESVFDAHPAEVAQGRPVGLAWFSPDCKHFSKAKGGKPREKRIRGLAWVVLHWIRTVRPRVIVLENVEEFQGWGPLDAEGRPVDDAKGWFFRCFVGAMRRRGYDVDWRELRACDFGAPTIRKRLFLVARCDGRPIVWPAPTHARPDSDLVAAKICKPWRTAAECIDWSIACPSIFERRRPLVDATCRRVARGVFRYVIDAAEPFIVPLTHHGDARVHGMRAPLPTITGANRGELALVAPTLVGIDNRGSGATAWDAQAPLTTITAEARHALVAGFLVKHYGGNESPGWPLERPMSTVTAKDHHGVVTSYLLKLRGDAATHAPGQPVDAPLHTLSAQGWHFAEVRAFLVKYYGSLQDPRLEEPMHTVTSRDRFALVTVRGERYAIADLGLRMLVPRELFRAQGFSDQYVIEWGYFAGADGRLVRRPLSKTAQVRMCGNSVSPAVACALVAANVPEMAVWGRRERREGVRRA
jgi:DNA (cytosine-5)-methyltransferase 1